MAKIRVGTRVLCDPLKNLRLNSTACFGITDDTKIKRGIITYVNKHNRWFLVECNIGNGEKVRRGYKFDCLGFDVQIA